MNTRWHLLSIFLIFVQTSFISASETSESVERALNSELKEVAFHDMQLSQVLDYLEQVSGIKMVLDPLGPEFNQKITFYARNITVREVLNKISFKYDLNYFAGTKEDVKLVEKIRNTEIEMDFSESPLSEIVYFISNKASINIVIHPSVYRKTGPIASSILGEIQMPLKLTGLLHILMDVYGLDYVIKNGSLILIGKPER